MILRNRDVCLTKELVNFEICDPVSIEHFNVEHMYSKQLLMTPNRQVGGRLVQVDKRFAKRKKVGRRLVCGMLTASLC